MKDDRVYLMHIRDNIEKIENSFKKAIKEDYDTDVDLQDATFRRFEVIGEAVKNISKETKKRFSEANWKGAVQTRDKLIHGYFLINADEVFKIVEKDLPTFKKQILAALEELNKEMGKR